jgi:hypothetical protein
MSKGGEQLFQAHLHRLDLQGRTPQHQDVYHRGFVLGWNLYASQLRAWARHWEALKGSRQDAATLHDVVALVERGPFHCDIPQHMGICHPEDSHGAPGGLDEQPDPRARDPLDDALRPAAGD